MNRLIHHSFSNLAKVCGSNVARGLAMRTVPTSVVKVTSKPANLDELEAKIEALRKRYPEAHIRRYLDKTASIHETAVIQPGACIIGDVRMSEESSVWYNCVLRADINHISLGKRSNLQDGTVVHLGDEDPTIVGDEVVVGHRVVIHGCKIGDGCLIGIQSTVLDGAEIGEGSIVAAGAVVTSNTKIPPHSLVMGTPGKVVKKLTAQNEKFHRDLALKYTRLAFNHYNG